MSISASGPAWAQDFFDEQLSHAPVLSALIMALCPSFLITMPCSSILFIVTNKGPVGKEAPEKKGPVPEGTGPFRPDSVHAAVLEAPLAGISPFPSVRRSILKDSTVRFRLWGRC